MLLWGEELEFSPIGEFPYTSVILTDPLGVCICRTVAASHTSRVPGGTVVMRATRGAAEHAFNSARALGTVKVVLPSGQTVSVPPEDML